MEMYYVRAMLLSTELGNCTQFKELRRLLSRNKTHRCIGKVLNAPGDLWTFKNASSMIDVAS
jgi:hypothetical protein